MRNMFTNFAALCLLTLGSVRALASQGVAEVKKLKGQVDILLAQGEMRPLRQGDRLRENDTVVTGNNGRVQIVFEEGGEKGKNIVVVGMNSRLKIQRASTQESDPGTRLFLEQGSVRSTVNRRYKGEGNDVFEVHTPNAVAGVRGTVFHVSYDKVQNESAIATIKGLVAVKLGYAAEVMVAPNQFTRSVQGVLQKVKEIQSDRIMQIRLKDFESQKFSGENAKVDSSANSSSKSALYKNSNRTIEQRNQIERAEKMSQRTGIPIEKALQYVVSDTVSDADQQKALQRLDGGIVSGVGGGGGASDTATIQPIGGDSNVITGTRYTGLPGSAGPTFDATTLPVETVDTSISGAAAGGWVAPTQRTLPGNANRDLTTTRTGVVTPNPGNNSGGNLWGTARPISGIVGNAIIDKAVLEQVQEQQTIQRTNFGNQIISNPPVKGAPEVERPQLDLPKADLPSADLRQVIQ